MASFYYSSVDEFLTKSDDHILASLGKNYAGYGYTSLFSEQTVTWERDIRSLRKTLEDCVSLSQSAQSWGVFLEFSIPRKEKRIDIVILVKDVIVVLEAKAGPAASQAKRQVEEYALLLHYFHKKSADLRIVPIVVSPNAGEPNPSAVNQRNLFPQLPSYWISQVIFSSWKELPDLLTAADDSFSEQIPVDAWNDSPYFPVPSIFEAALALRSGLSIREIAHSEASGMQFRSM
jgi:hypothetical protein